MNRIEELFKAKGKNVLSVYFTAGFPELSSTRPIIQELARAGADLIEIGIPFSDPMADGVTIQESNQAALVEGFTIERLFEELKDVRKEASIPIVLMTYFNPVFKYGFDRFCQQANACGIDGLIIPDLPLSEYHRNYQDLFERYGLSICFLITSETDEQRIRAIDAATYGFIYLVTSPGVTGREVSFSDSQIAALKRIGSMQLKNPVLAGFGISNKEGFETVCRYVNGAIIGSSFIRSIAGREKELPTTIHQFIQSILHDRTA